MRVERHIDISDHVGQTCSVCKRPILQGQSARYVLDGPAVRSQHDACPGPDSSEYQRR